LKNATVAVRRVILGLATNIYLAVHCLGLLTWECTFRSMWIFLFLRALLILDNLAVIWFTSIYIILFTLTYLLAEYFLAHLYIFFKENTMCCMGNFINAKCRFFCIRLWSEILASEERKFTGKEALSLVEGLSSITSFKILMLLSKESLDVSSIARRMKLSQAHISGEISRLEDLQLVMVSYAPGKRGIRKVCKLAVKQISIVI